MHHDIEAIQQRIHAESAFVERLLDAVGRVIVGQRAMVERLLVGLLADGHVLMEGVPGLAKTMTVRTLADAVATTFRRIQFTPDLLPADLIGTLVYDPRQSEFKTRKGPIFANIILADEINRSPAKVQSALLEAMQERTVTIGDASYALDSPFLVLATQNPIEQEGTYPLPEAQVDRFMLKLAVTYPDKDEEIEILRRMGAGPAPAVEAVVEPDEILRARKAVAWLRSPKRCSRTGSPGTPRNSTPARSASPRRSPPPKRSTARSPISSMRSPSAAPSATGGEPRSARGWSASASTPRARSPRWPPPPP